MKVLVVEIYGRGGLTHYTYNLVTALSRRGIDVTLATAAEYELAAPLASGGGVRLEPIFYAASARARRWIAPLRNPRIRRPVKMLEYVLGTPGVVRLHRRLRPDVVHLQGSNPILLVTLLALKTAGARVIYTAHDVAPLANRRLSRLLDRFLYRLADRVVVHGEADRDALLTRHDVPAAKVSVIRHGNYLFFDAAPAAAGNGIDGRASRERLGLPADARVVLFFGFLSWYKGLDLLVECFREVRAAVPRAMLLIAGDPLKLAPGELEGLRERAASLGIADAIRWRTDYIPMEDVPDWFRAADCVALPYREVSQSGVLHLAQAFSRPVVATRVGAFPELVTDGVTGCLVEPGDLPALTGAIVRLLDDPVSGARMGAAGRAVAESSHGWDEVAGETERLYGLLAGGRAS